MRAVLKIILAAALVFSYAIAAKGEIVSLKARPGASVDFLIVEPKNPFAAVVLFEGGGGTPDLQSPGGRGFMNGSRGLFAENGLAFSLVTPSLMALLIDRVRPEARGVAVGTFTAGFDLGVGLGAFISGRLLELMDFPAMYRLIAGAPLAGLVIFVLVRRTHRREGPSG